MWMGKFMVGARIKVCDILLICDTENMEEKSDGNKYKEVTDTFKIINKVC